MCGASFAVGLGATKSAVKVFAQPGTEVESAPFRLINPGARGAKFYIRLRTNGTGGKDGYQRAPHTRWFKVTPETVFAGGNSESADIRVKVLIPDSAQYYNRRFICWIEVSQLDAKALSTGLVLPLLVDTAPTRAVPPQCEGCGVVIYPHRIDMTGRIDSVLVVNWGDDTARVTIGWNKPGWQGWRGALMFMENVMGGLVPTPDTITIAPKRRKKIFIKPLAFPGKGRIYFSGLGGRCLDFAEIRWREQ